MNDIDTSILACHSTPRRCSECKFRGYEECVNELNKYIGVDAVPPPSNSVDHPSHYNMGNIEVIDAIEDWGLGEGFNKGNAIKYIARAGHKDSSKTIEDLEKAAWYINREIEKLKQPKKNQIMYDSLLHCYNCNKTESCLDCPHNGIKLDILNFLDKYI